MARLLLYGSMQDMPQSQESHDETRNMLRDLQKKLRRELESVQNICEQMRSVHDDHIKTNPKKNSDTFMQNWQQIEKRLVELRQFLSQLERN